MMRAPFSLILYHHLAWLTPNGDTKLLNTSGFFSYNDMELCASLRLDGIGKHRVTISECFTARWPGF